MVERWGKTLLNILFFFFIACSHGAEVRIKGVDDFINFTNSGTSYSGTTVFLDSDLSLSGYATINPISYFRGVFDGQGYMISNLIITSSSEYVGLFGYSRGLTIRNVVLDSSCSITNTYIGSGYAYTGGIVGKCFSWYGQCNVENCVNMASVTFSGSISGYDSLYLGGIAGELYSEDYNIYLKNCANYGSVTHSGNSKYSYIGGVTGYVYSYSYYNYYSYIYNCLNYGTITHSGTTSDYLYLGGIAGCTYYAYIENCVSAGIISSNNNYYIGSLICSVISYTYINYCYYTDELSGYGMYGRGTPTSTSNTLGYNNNTFILDETVYIGNYSGHSLIDALNAASDYYILRDYSHWLLNKDENTVNFTLNNRENSIEMDYQVILLPSLASEGNISFNGWYNDSEYESLLTVPEVTSDTSLYGKYEINTNNYTITFDTRGGTPVPPMQAQFGTTVSLPNNLTKDSCTVASWETVYGDNVGLSLVMPAHNTTLYPVWKCTHIKTPDDFLDFSKIVNSGTSDYSGTTVFLDSDLLLSGYTTINPIGASSNYQFRGVFDGQGYVISNLTISSSSSYYAGLFGYSYGLTIRNVVLDSSCSITSTSSSSYDDVYAGGIIGCCSSRYGQCNIENNVNMASVAFSGNISGNNWLYLGGIVGYLSSGDYNIYVKNCANYGSVTKTGTSYGSRIGGILGYLYSYYLYYEYIYNCLNYGTITHDGTSTYLCLGGIVGYTYYTYIENCVSAGTISILTTAKYDNYIGSLVGLVNSGTYINYCYYTEELSDYSIYGSGKPTSTSNTLIYNGSTFILDETVYIGNYSENSIIGALNAASDYYMLRGYSYWLLNKDENTVNFTLNTRENSIEMDYQVILLPSLASEGNISFNGWYNDSEYESLLTVPEITSDISLYGKIEINTNNYTITFDTRGGTPADPITAQFGTNVSLPNSSTKDSCTVASWETVYGDNVGLSLVMPAHNITLYPVWKCIYIKASDDFLVFINKVNSGTSDYSGTPLFSSTLICLSLNTPP